MRTLAILAFAALFGATACGGGGATQAAPQSARVGISLSDNSIAVGPTTAAAGAITFTVKNVGSVVHSMVILRTDLDHAKIPADPKDASKVQEAGKIAATGQLAPGETKELVLDLASGKYVVVCNEPAHYLIGMHTGLTVR